MSEHEGRASAQDDEVVETPEVEPPPEAAADDAAEAQVAPDAAPDAAPAPGQERWQWLALLGPLLVYLPLIRRDFLFGDGPELLTALYNLGGAHPSGYPLFTLLGHLPARLGAWLGTPHLNVTLMLAVLPSALTSWLLYRMVRHLGAGVAPSLLACGLYACNYRVMYQSTRVEVYALHCLLFALALYAMTRHATSAKRREDPRWLYASCAAICLGLTNHLTSALFIPAFLVLGFTSGWRLMLKPKTILGLLAISVGCGAIYLYLPLHAMANADAHTVSWNDPQTLERFWFHVTGEEYASFRKLEKFEEGAQRLGKDLENKLFPGVVLVALLGALELALSRWRVVLAMVLALAPLFVYIATYTIGDIATYYSPVFLVICALMALGTQWFFNKRFDLTQRRQLVAWALVVAVGWGAILGGMAWRNRGLRYTEANAEGMSDTIMTTLPERAIFFTASDFHTFPMWYQAYVKHPDRELVTFDRTMFSLKNKQWYRDFLRKRHPQVRWPDDAMVLRGGGHWERYLVRENAPTYRSFALLAKPWNVTGMATILRGWHHELVMHKRTDPKPEDGHEMLMHVHMSRYDRLRSQHFFHSAATRFEVGDRLACVAEWFEHDEVTATWTLYGPNDKVVTFKPHKVDKNSTISWEFLEPKDQVAGQWRCEIKYLDKPTIVLPFTLE